MSSFRRALRTAPVLAGLTLVSMTAPSHADMPVIDPTSIAQQALSLAKQAAMVNNQITQITQLASTLNSLSHGNVAALGSVASELSGLGIMQNMGSDATGLMADLPAIGALGRELQQTGAMSQQLMSQASQMGTVSGSDWTAQRILTMANQLSTIQSVAQTSLRNTETQLNAIMKMRGSLDGMTNTQVGAAQVAARFAGEGLTLQAGTNRLLAYMIMSNATVHSTQDADIQTWRCWSQHLAAQADTVSQSTANLGITAVATVTGSACQAPASAATDAMTASLTTSPTGSFDPNQFTKVADNSGGNPSVDSTSDVSGLGSSLPASSNSNDSTILAKMTSNPWGNQAATNASAIGVNPTALAATCVLESNCNNNVGGTGSISGAFQMTNAAYNESVAGINKGGSDVAGSLTSKSDPVSMAAASAQYMLNGATSLQSAGISNPTVLDTRAYYQFGPGNAATVANATDNQLLGPMLVGLPANALPANNITSTTTVGQWRASIVNKIGNTAYSPVLTNA